MMKLRKMLLAAVLMPLCALAGETTLVVELNSGEMTTYALLEQPVVTMVGTQVQIVTATVQTGYERGDVKRFFFTGDPNSVKELSKDALVYKQTDANHLEISGLSKNDRITVSDAGGRQCGSVSISDSRAVVSLNGQHKGIYLVRVGNKQTIKFVKK